MASSQLEHAPALERPPPGAHGAAEPILRGPTGPHHLEAVSADKAATARPTEGRVGTPTATCEAGPPEWPFNALAAARGRTT